MRRATIFRPISLSCIISILLLGFSGLGYALDFRSISANKAIMYDAPSTEASKVYLLGEGYPVEVIVNLGRWLKVRDQQGGLSWVESKDLADKRMVLVTKSSPIKAAADAESTLLATADKDVVLELVSPAITNGWIQVKHRDGVLGYIQANDVWGLN